MDGSGTGLEGECGSEGGYVWVGLALELHADLDEVERVRGTTRDDGSDASFDETLDTHDVVVVVVVGRFNLGGVEVSV